MSGSEATTAEATRWDELARSAGRGVVDPDAVEEIRQLLCFRLGSASYAVAIESVREIVRIGPITPIPRVAAHVRGVISLRGEMLEVIDLRAKLSLDPIEITKATRIVVVTDLEGHVAGLLVDEVREVLRVAQDAIGPAAAGDAQGLVCGLCVRDGAFVSLLDLDRTLGGQDA
jgi:purine-binding chemotaxis protein CheW